MQNQINLSRVLVFYNICRFITYLDIAATWEMRGRRRKKRYENFFRILNLFMTWLELWLYWGDFIFNSFMSWYGADASKHNFKLTWLVILVIFWSHFRLCSFLEVSFDLQYSLVTSAWLVTCILQTSNFWFCIPCQLLTDDLKRIACVSSPSWDRNWVERFLFRDMPFSCCSIINLWYACWCVTQVTHWEFTSNCFMNISLNSDRSLSRSSLICDIFSLTFAINLHSPFFRHPAGRTLRS